MWNRAQCLPLVLCETSFAQALRSGCTRWLIRTGNSFYHFLFNTMSRAAAFASSGRSPMCTIWASSFHLHQFIHPDLSGDHVWRDLHPPVKNLLGRFPRCWKSTPFALCQHPVECPEVQFPVFGPAFKLSAPVVCFHRIPQWHSEKARCFCTRQTSTSL